MNEHFDLTYKSLFRRYYTNLLFYATRIVGEEDAEDVVEAERYHAGGRADSGFSV